jgi:DNA polymerase I-like protein with 3'-5' exonuclease and polymerase domains
MQVMAEFTKNISEMFLEEKVIFVSYDPEKFDSTTFAKLYLKLKFTTKQNRSFIATITPENAHLVRNIILKLQNTSKAILVGHNLKPFFTFMQRITKKPLRLTNIIDLGWYESYTAKASSKANLKAQIESLTALFGDRELLKLYKRIYLPLIVEVIPELESTGLVEDNLGMLVFPNYHIEGQNNGRLSTSCEYKRCYNPHSLGDDQKLNLKLINKHQMFLHMDYRNMEVVVLAHLANDITLLNIIKEKPYKVYEEIFELATGQKDFAEARNVGKKLFLPVIYGQTEGGLASSLGISREQSAIYISNLHKHFRDSFAFVEVAQKEAASNGCVIDHFGRKRILQSDETHKARNFVIQSPSALICIESLVNLYNGRYNDDKEIFKIAFHVHDGYCVFADDGYMQETYKTCHNILCQPSKLIENLNLNVSSKIGKSLAKMAEIRKR